MRAVICRGLVGSGDDEGGQMRLRQAFEERDAARDCERLSFMLGPHAPYTCDDAYMRIVSEEAKKNRMGIHVHLSESENEISQIKEKYGMSPIEMADRNGLFDVPAIAAHCVQITESDMDILKEKRQRGHQSRQQYEAGQRFCPRSRHAREGNQRVPWNRRGCQQQQSESVP